MIHEDILPDERINEVWGNANFGNISKRVVIYETLIRCLAGYQTGKTSSTICIELNLIFSNKWDLTAKGKKYLGEYLLETKKQTQ